MNVYNSAEKLLLLCCLEEKAGLLSSALTLHLESHFSLDGCNLWLHPLRLEITDVDWTT